MTEETECFCGRPLIPGGTPVCSKCRQQPDVCDCDETEEMIDETVKTDDA